MWTWRTSAGSLSGPGCSASEGRHEPRVGGCAGRGGAVVVGAGAGGDGAGGFPRRGVHRPEGLAAAGGWVCGGRLHRLRVSPAVGSWNGSGVVRAPGGSWAGGGAAGDRRVGGARQAAAGAAPGSRVRGRALPTVLAPWWAMPDARVRRLQAVGKGGRDLSGRGLRVPGGAGAVVVRRAPGAVQSARTVQATEHRDVRGLDPRRTRARRRRLRAAGGQRDAAA